MRRSQSAKTEAYGSGFPNSGTTQAIQVSFIAVAGKASEEPSEPVSKTLLERYLNDAKGYVEDGTVSGLVESVQKLFADAIAKGEAVMADGDALQAETDEAWNTLVEAMNALRLKADKSVLEDLISQMEGMDLSGYTEESVSVFRARRGGKRSAYR